MAERALSAIPGIASEVRQSLRDWGGGGRGVAYQEFDFSNFHSMLAKDGNFLSAARRRRGSDWSTTARLSQNPLTDDHSEEVSRAKLSARVMPCK